ncbi:Globin-coupled histidine kinase [Fundidesulfovibrio magnetotacticus]|uniref:histidine kinase n=1 Tax=Fundidesulfovibrio magnetotacticus TaxID=2730080 RepID=A0A6V8LW58_9BACT|nr:XrtA/PEP-CTERM system histidine kinase PrsK [Fundidesulfovibrio magnetotacticus]GFK93897.1 Globin-coupled histidine kinase [Fundidesulfovibrio magnetotacticus]
MIQTTILVLSVLASAALALRMFFLRGNAPGLRTGVAALLLCAALEALDSMLLAQASASLRLAQASMTLGGLAALAWLIFCLDFSRSEQHCARNTPLKRWALLAMLLYGALLLLPPDAVFDMDQAWDRHRSHLSWLGFSFEAGTLSVLIVGMFQLESTLAGAVHGKRWQIKYFIVGVISILASQAFIISLGLLYRSLDYSLIPARQLGLLSGVGLIWHSLRRKGQDVSISMTCRQAQRSIVLFAAGVYLLGLGCIGLAMQFLGGGIDRIFLLAIGGASGVCLIVVLISESFRRKALQIFREYFPADKYDYRAQWLAFTRRLTASNSRESLYRAVLLGFCDTFGMGGGILWLREADTGEFSPEGLLELDAPSWRLASGDGVCATLDARKKPLDLRLDGPGNADPLAAGLSELKAAFAVPVFLGDSLDGVIMLCRQINKGESWDREDFDLMEALANQAQASIHNLRLADQLAKARDMEVMGKVSTFIAHDLKNLVYTLSLILENAKRYIGNEEFQKDMLGSLDNTVSRMHRLIAQIKQLPTRETMRFARVDLAELARDSIKQLPLGNVRFAGESTPATVDPTQMRKVIANLVINAVEASPEASEVLIETGCNGGPYLAVTDNGVGMSEEFIRNELYEPFKTSKPKGMGIGLYQSKHIVEAHGGRIDVLSAPGQGARFTVRFPDVTSMPQADAA